MYMRTNCKPKTSLTLTLCLTRLFVFIPPPQGASRAESHYAGPLSADGADAAVPSVAALLQGDGGGEEPCAHVSVRRECGGEGGGV